MRLTKEGINKSGIQEEILRAIRPIAERHGLVAQQWGGSIETNREVILKFKLKADSVDLEIERQEFQESAFLFGLKPEDYGKAFDYKGTTYHIVGFSRSRHKYPIVGRGFETGRTMYFTESILKQIK